MWLSEGLKSAVEGLLYAFKFTLGNFNDLFMRKVQNEKKFPLN